MVIQHELEVNEDIIVEKEQQENEDSIDNAVLVAEAEVATSKAFIGPPEVRGRGHSGLSEDITDQALTGPLSLCTRIFYLYILLQITLISSGMF